MRNRSSRDEERDWWSSGAERLLSVNLSTAACLRTPRWLELWVESSSQICDSVIHDISCYTREDHASMIRDGGASRDLEDDSPQYRVQRQSPGKVTAWQSYTNYTTLLWKTAKQYCFNLADRQTGIKTYNIIYNMLYVVCFMSVCTSVFFAVSVLVYNVLRAMLPEINLIWFDLI